MLTPHLPTSTHAAEMPLGAMDDKEARRQDLIEAGLAVLATVLFMILFCVALVVFA